MKKLIFALIILNGCTQPTKDPAKYYPLEELALQNEPVNVEYFKNGQIIYPDYAIPETLIVIDAEKLNYDMGRVEQGLIEATDGEIATIFYKHCKTLSK